jgi:hypothetical protein
MSSIYGRLGFNFDTTKFDGADVMPANVANFLGNTSIHLSQWQVDDIANATTTGYYQNPHNDVLGTLSVFIGGLKVYANTANYANPDLANTLLSAANSTENSLISFVNHTNNLSGVTRSSNTSIYPDLSSALSIGRQILNITNKTDGVQNNTPILGNFTSLYINSDLVVYNHAIANDYITLDSSMSADANGNLTSNITSLAMNVIIADIQGLQNLINGRMNGDISFYINSLEISKEYSTVVQFSSVGNTQNNIIKLIGTDKLKDDLANNKVVV